MIRVLFISRKSDRCGVADYGRRVYEILSKSDKLELSLAEVDGWRDWYETDPDVLLINYHHSTLHFVNGCMFFKPVVAIFHEGPVYIIPNVTIDTSIRPLFENIPLDYVTNPVPTIGSFGFGFPDKNFPRVAQMVRDQFGMVKLRLNIPFAEFGDSDGALAMGEVQKVKEILQGTNITLDVSHEYLSQSDLLKWLRANDLNLFLYNNSHGRGLSSTIDYALSVRKPIGVSSSEMFKHLPSSVCVDNTSLTELIRNGTEPLESVYKEHTNEKLIKKYEDIILNLLT